MMIEGTKLSWLGPEAWPGEEQELGAKQEQGRSMSMGGAGHEQGRSRAEQSKAERGRRMAGVVQELRRS